MSHIKISKVHCKVASSRSRISQKSCHVQLFSREQLVSLLFGSLAGKSRGRGVAAGGLDFIKFVAL